MQANDLVLPTDYPSDRLLPQPGYVAEVPAELLGGGWLCRRTPSPQPFVEENGRAVVLPAQLCAMSQDIARGYSVNLLGQFEVADCGWVAVSEAGKECARTTWKPGDAALEPAPGDMGYVPQDAWGSIVMPVDGPRATHGLGFEVEGSSFRCEVCHAPMMCNYWHYELHFVDSEGKPLSSYPEGKKRRIAKDLQQKFAKQANLLPAGPTTSYPHWPNAIFGGGKPLVE